MRNSPKLGWCGCCILLDFASLFSVSNSLANSLKREEDNNTQLNFDHICIWTSIHIFSRYSRARESFAKRRERERREIYVSLSSRSNVSFSCGLDNVDNYFRRNIRVAPLD